MSPKHEDHIKRISKEWPEIQFTDDDISITGPGFILDSLKKEVLVLKELCENLGYKHKRIIRSDIDGTNFTQNDFRSK